MFKVAFELQYMIEAPDANTKTHVSHVSLWWFVHMHYCDFINVEFK